MSGVERFNPICKYHETEGYPFAEMFAHPSGSYVLATDFDTALAAKDALLAARDAALIELQSEGSAYRSRLATAENQVASLTKRLARVEREGWIKDASIAHLQQMVRGKSAPWIPVSESVPEYERDVLTTDKNEKVAMCYRFKTTAKGEYWRLSHGQKDSSDDWDDVIAWCEVQQPYAAMPNTNIEVSCRGEE